MCLSDVAHGCGVLQERELPMGLRIQKTQSDHNLVYRIVGNLQAIIRWQKFGLYV